MKSADATTKFHSIVTPHLRDAFSYAKWLVGNRSDAEDILQESCLSAFRSIDTYNGGHSRAWLLTIVRNRAYSWLKKNRPSHVVPLDALNRDDRAAAEQGNYGNEQKAMTPEVELIAKVDAAQLEQSIAGLPLEFREVLVLREIQGLAYREIAEITSIPIGTVMSRLARARRRLIGAIGMQA